MDTSELYKLPNGMEIYHVNDSETDFTYKEIFEELIYLRHGITIPSNGVIFDVGANIGLFSLLVAKTYPNSIVFAFEPIPFIFSILLKNVARFSYNIKAFEVGLSDRCGEVDFSFYPQYTILSGCYGDTQLDRSLLTNIVKQQYISKLNYDQLEAEKHAARLARTKLHPHICRCKLLTLSKIIQDHNVTTIDLLKIDVEKSELDVLSGISDGDWGKIQQVVLEVHDDSDQVYNSILDLLRQKKFDVFVEQQQEHQTTAIHMLYARK